MTAGTFRRYRTVNHLSGCTPPALLLLRDAPGDGGAALDALLQPSAAGGTKAWEALPGAWLCAPPAAAA